MNTLAKDELRSLYIANGLSIVRDAGRCEALLRDRCPASKKEIAVLVGAVKCGVAAELSNRGASVSSSALHESLVKRMQDQNGFASDAAEWGVDVWSDVIVGRREYPETPKSEIPDQAIVAASLWGRRLNSPEVCAAKAYVERALARGNTAESVRDDFIRCGYPLRLAEAVVWLGSPRSDLLGDRLIKDGFKAAGAQLLIIAVLSCATGELWFPLFLQILFLLNVFSIIVGFAANIPRRFERSYWMIVRQKEQS